MDGGEVAHRPGVVVLGDAQLQQGHQLFGQQRRLPAVLAEHTARTRGAQQPEIAFDVAGSGAAQGELASLRRVPLAALAFRVERSEEHTSELQSLMRISYAVF